MSMKGFTLIETLVAITILTTAIVGPFYAIQSASRTSYLARDNVIAASLAQEAIEYIRSVRDNNYLAGQDWLEGLESCLPGPCTVDPTQLSGDIGTNIEPLYLSTTNVYNQQRAGEQTRYTRTVEMTTINEHEVTITVTVEWERHGAQTVIITETIQDWL